MATYIHELPGWPEFRWNEAGLTQRLAALRHEQGRLIGRMEALGFDLRAEAVLATLTQDVLTSSEIEGEFLDRDQVRSSVARRLGLEIGALPPTDRHVEGVVEMMVDATQNYAAPLTADRVFAWHAALFPTGRSGMTKIRVGAWRDGRSGPMQVVSGPIGKERVHFEAPTADRLDQEMTAFLDWWNQDQGLDPVLKAALGHFWFVTLHPFDDGNGRIARAIADMGLARSEQSPQRFYSLSSQIGLERQAYYNVLETRQKGDLDVSDWLAWFMGCLERAIGGAQDTLSEILAKARFWADLEAEPINARQRMVLNRLLEGFDGKLTSSKWARLTHASPDTALRDITDLVARGVLVKDTAGGRSTSYALRRARPVP